MRNSKITKRSKDATHPVSYSLTNFRYKSKSIWKYENFEWSPMLILQKPISMSEKDYDEFVDKLTITVKK